eukprot:COSAG01_NODE_362_length_18130_cov_34.672307_3_plen_101_part_00
MLGVVNGYFTTQNPAASDLRGECDEATCFAVAEGGHLKVLQWAMANGCEWNADTCAGAAGGHLRRCCSRGPYAGVAVVACEKVRMECEHLRAAGGGHLLL